MTLRPLRTCLFLAGLPALLLACGEKESGDDPRTDGADGSDDGGTDTNAGDDGADDGGDDTAAPILLVADALLDVSPLTLPAETGGDVIITLQATAWRGRAETLPLEEAIAPLAFSAALPNGETVDAHASIDEAGQLQLALTLPGGLSTATRLPFTLQVDGAALTTAAVGLYTSPEALLTSFTGDRTGHIPRTTAAPVCAAFAVDADFDGLLEVITLSAEGSTITLTGCAAQGDAGDPTWACTDEKLEADVKTGEGLLCGTTDHFRTMGHEIGIGALLATTEGRSVALRGQTWAGGSWTGTGSTTTSSAFAVVLGLNTTKEDPPANLTGVLVIEESGGRWTGSYGDTTPWTWSKIGDLSPETIAAGKAWAGLFADQDLSTRSGGADSTFAWTIDPSGIAGGGDLRVTVLEPRADLSAFSRLRDLRIAPPEFTIEAATASGEDLDDDGYPELLIEAWGEGQYAAWLVPAASNKAATGKIRRIASHTGDQGGAAYRVQENSDGSFATVRPSFALAMDGSLIGTFALLADAQRTADDTPTHAVIATESWTFAELMNGGDTDVEPFASSLIGQSPILSKPIAGGDRGVCLRGKCHCLPGFLGTMRVEDSPGSGAVAANANSQVAIGVDPSDDALIVSLLSPGSSHPVLQGRLSDESLATIALRGEAGGFMVDVNGEPWMSVGPATALALAAGPDGVEPVLFAFDPAYAGAAGDPPNTVTITPNIRVRYQDSSGQGALPPGTTTGGATTPVLLGDQLGVDEGLLIGWRDGLGQTWVGLLDVAGAALSTGGELPFLEGPVALGKPLADVDALGLSADRPGLLALNRATPPGALLSTDSFGQRFSTWDTPMEVPFAEITGAHGPLVLLAGDGSGGDGLFYAGAVDDLSTFVLEPLSEGGLSSEKIPVPVVQAALLPDLPPVLVTRTGLGTVDLHLFDGSGLVAQRRGVGTLEAGTVHAGDVNGDGLADLIAGQGQETALWLSDGRGGALDDPGLDPRVFTNFALLLGGLGGRDRSCDTDADGGSTDTVGTPLFGR